MSIVLWQADRWSNEPVEKTYAKETAHFGVYADGRRDAKVSTYSCLFRTKQEAQQWIDQKKEQKESARKLRLVREAAPELLEAAEHCRELLMRYEINRVNGEEIADEAIAKLNAAIARARGES